MAGLAGDARPLRRRLGAGGRCPVEARAELQQAAAAAVAAVAAAAALFCGRMQ